MRDRASGFCIYNDPALAIARARRDGLRVMYIDLDVHHGDGVQALFWDDPGVLTFSIHESGRYLFPGTGDADEVGEGVAAGTAVNVPLPPYTGEAAWYPILESYLPVLAAAFGPDLIVSQHGADSHAWDPLAHLHVTTTAHGKAARLVDAVAHRYGGGRWLATGGGGYDAYRVVPRTWALTWLAGAHRDAPSSTPEAWRERWADEAARYGQAPLPERFDDEVNAGVPYDLNQEASEQRAVGLAAIHRAVVVPRLLRFAMEADWWSPLAAVAAQSGSAADPAGTPTIVPGIDADAWSRLTLLPRVIAPADASDGHALVAAALRGPAPAAVSAAVVGSSVVGLAVSAPADPGDGTRELLAARGRPDLPTTGHRDRAAQRARGVRIGRGRRLSPNVIRSIRCRGRSVRRSPAACSSVLGSRSGPQMRRRGRSTRRHRRSAALGVAAYRQGRPLDRRSGSSAEGDVAWRTVEDARDVAADVGPEDAVARPLSVGFGQRRVDVGGSRRVCGA